MKKALVLALGLAAGVAQAATVVSDDFSVIQNLGSYVTSGPIGLSAWNVTRSGDDWAARIDGNVLELSNDAGRSTNFNGYVFASLTLSDSGGFDTTLANCSDEVSWSFNLRQIRDNPAGFTPTNAYGAAFVLGATGNTLNNSGNGYAVVLGNSGTNDPIRLVNFTGGLQGTLTELISASAPLNDVGLEHLSLKVTYNPADNGWTLAGRLDGAAFVDPSSGTLSALGSATDSTFTGTDLTYMGGYWQGSTSASQTAKFDNVTLSVIPEPASFGLLALGAIGARLLRRRL